MSSQLTDRKHIKVGDDWFDMMFYADGSITRFCIAGMKGGQKDHAIVMDLEAKQYWCKNCDWIQA